MGLDHFSNPFSVRLSMSSPHYAFLVIFLILVQRIKHITIHLWTSFSVHFVWFSSFITFCFTLQDFLLVTFCFTLWDLISFTFCFSCGTSLLPFSSPSVSYLLLLHLYRLLLLFCHLRLLLLLLVVHDKHQYQI